jgi:hypothetical protein
VASGRFVVLAHGVGVDVAQAREPRAQLAHLFIHTFRDAL